MITQRSLPYRSDSTHYFEKLRPLGQAVFLDSGRPLCPWGRFDILSAAPIDTITYKNDDSSAAFDALEALYQQYQTPLSENPDLPFQGGLIGHFNYDLGRSFAKLSIGDDNEYLLPEMSVGMYLWALVVDHHKETATLVAHPTVEIDLLKHIERRLTANEQCPPSSFALKAPFKANINREKYHDKLQTIHDYILKGDCYQVNFAQRFSTTYTGDTWSAYKALRTAAPTPYSAYIETDKSQILSLSPEQFLEVQMGNVTTKPIKGTRPRSEDRVEDQNLKDDLLNSSKDRAENLMIVDLLRNDLSKVCEHNSVKVPKLFQIESYANVHHKVSTVTGQLKQEQSPVNLLKHCFPGGSITGAPKIRAMQIIDELEEQQRSIYCGSIGYISLCGRMDTSITIRTLLCEHGNIYCWAGGGIVADSDSQMEYEETFSKVNNLLNCLNGTQLKE